jgi:hypothetical protein
MVMFAINLDFFAVLAALAAAVLQFSVITIELQWLVSGYMLALASCLVVGGPAAGVFRRVVPMATCCRQATGTWTALS